MISKIICIAVMIALVDSSVIAQEYNQPASQKTAQMQQVLRTAQAKDKTVIVTLKKKIGKVRRFCGRVSQVSDVGFVLTDQGSGATTDFSYADVREVRRKGLPKSADIAIGVGIIAGILGGILIAIYPKT